MRNCFVPNCDAMHRNNDIVKRMMFMPPKDAYTFAIWSSALKGGKREFRLTDRVCQLHFDEDDIETHWDHVINGEVHKLKRGKPKLRSNAVPKLFLNSKFKMSTPKMGNGPTQKEIKLRMLKRKTVVPKKEELELSAPIKLRIEEASEPQEEEEILPVEVTDMALSEQLVDAIFCGSDSEDEASRDSRFIAFETLYDDVFEVELPCTSYGVHRDPERTFIAFSRFNPATLSTSKALFIDNRLRTKSIVDGITVTRQKHDCLPVDKIVELLNQLDAMRLCEWTNDSEKCCELAVDGESFCVNCALK